MPRTIAPPIPDVPTLDDLPVLDDVRAIDGSAPGAFAADGCAVLRGLLSPEEAALFRAVIEPAALQHAFNRGREADDGSLEGAFLQSYNLWCVDERIARFVLARRFASVAAELLGVERVRLYHDQALCKGPRGGRTPWHQDQHYWPLATDRTITMWMPLVDIGADTGSLTFAAGSHRLGSLGGTGINRESEQAFAAVIEERSLPTRTFGAMRAGDASFHSGWALHSAGPNPADTLRTVMTVIYFADGTHVVDDPSPAQEVDRQVWLGGREPGALADHALNPVLDGGDVADADAGARGADDH